MYDFMVTSELYDRLISCSIWPLNGRGEIHIPLQFCRHYATPKANVQVLWVEGMWGYLPRGSGQKSPSPKEPLPAALRIPSQSFWCWGSPGAAGSIGLGCPPVSGRSTLVPKEQFGSQAIGELNGAYFWVDIMPQIMLISNFSSFTVLGANCVLQQHTLKCCFPYQ